MLRSMSIAFFFLFSNLLIQVCFGGDEFLSGGDSDNPEAPVRVSIHHVALLDFLREDKKDSNIPFVTDSKSLIEKTPSERASPSDTINDGIARDMDKGDQSDEQKEAEEKASSDDESNMSKKLQAADSELEKTESKWEEASAEDERVDRDREDPHGSVNGKGSVSAGKSNQLRQTQGIIAEKVGLGADRKVPIADEGVPSVAEQETNTNKKIAEVKKMSSKNDKDQEKLKKRVDDNEGVSRSEDAKVASVSENLGEIVDIDALISKGGNRDSVWMQEKGACSVENIKKIKEDMISAAKIRANCAKRKYLTAAGNQAASMCKRVILQLVASEKSVQNLRRQNSSLKSKVFESEQKIESLIIKNNNLAGGGAKIAKYLARERRKSSNLEDDVEELESQNALSKRAIEKFRNENMDLKERLESLKNEVRNLKETIPSLANSKKDISASELNDACAGCSNNDNCGSDGVCESGNCVTLKSRGQSCWGKCSRCKGDMICKDKPGLGKVCCEGDSTDQV